LEIKEFAGIFKKYTLCLKMEGTSFLNPKIGEVIVKNLVSVTFLNTTKKKFKSNQKILNIF
jgi:hypothetical protein